MEAPFPENEYARLKTLFSYEILDTPPEPQFDDLTYLASHICDVPIALISLIDSSRQWFKSARGISARETDRNIAFCSHAILQEHLLEVPDALRDERFADNPLVTREPGIRFYAGAPLQAPNGDVLGTICVIDRTPRQLNPHQQEALRALSRQVISLMELRRHIKQREQLITDLKAAYNKVKVLGGLLPICSECKSIRDGAGYWKRVEEYLQTHSEAKLTHRFCPTCAKHLYPEIYHKLLQDHPEEYGNLQE